MTEPETPTHDGRTARELAGDAERNLLGILHLAEAEERPLDAEQIFGTLSGLTRMLEHVPEVITRLRAAVPHRHDAGAMRVDAGKYKGDPGAAAQALTDAVDEFLAGFGALRTNMERAQASVSNAQFDDTGDRFQA